MVVSVRENYINIIEPKTSQWLLGALNDAELCRLFISDGNLEICTAVTNCLRESPLSLGPCRGPQKSLVVITRSVRRNPSSLITRPLEIMSKHGRKILVRTQIWWELTFLLQISHPHTLQQCRTYLSQHRMLFGWFPTPVLGEKKARDRFMEPVSDLNRISHDGPS